MNAMRDKYKQHKKAIAKELEFLEKQENALALSMEKRRSPVGNKILSKRFLIKYIKIFKRHFVRFLKRF